MKVPNNYIEMYRVEISEGHTIEEHLVIKTLQLMDVTHNLSKGYLAKVMRGATSFESAKKMVEKKEALISLKYHAKLLSPNQYLVILLDKDVKMNRKVGA